MTNWALYLGEVAVLLWGLALVIRVLHHVREPKLDWDRLRGPLADWVVGTVESHRESELDAEVLEQVVAGLTFSVAPWPDEEAAILSARSVLRAG